MGSHVLQTARGVRALDSNAPYLHTQLPSFFVLYSARAIVRHCQLYLISRLLSHVRFIRTTEGSVCENCPKHYLVSDFTCYQARLRHHFAGPTTQLPGNPSHHKHSNTEHSNIDHASMTRNKKTHGNKKLDSPITMINPSTDDIVSTNHAVASTSDHTTTPYSSNANAAHTLYNTVSPILK